MPIAEIQLDRSSTDARDEIPRAGKLPQRQAEEEAEFEEAEETDTTLIFRFAHGACFLNVALTRRSSERRPDEFDSVFGGDFRQRLDRFRGWRGGRREVGAFGWAAQRADETFEIAAGGDGQEAAARWRFGAVSVRHALRREQKIARPGAKLFVLELEANRTF